MIGFCLAFSGCSGPEPLNQPWSQAEQARALAAMQSVARGHTPSEVPGRAPHGVRWSDVRFAADLAATDTEMAILRIEPLREDVGVSRIEPLRAPPAGSPAREEDPGSGWRFVLVTIGDAPGELIVLRRYPPVIYQARASIGVFGDRDDLADNLLDAFDTRMRELGLKKDF